MIGPRLDNQNGEKPLPRQQPEWAEMMSVERRQSYIDQGVQERFIIDRTTHPMYHASLWNSYGKGDTLLGPHLSYRLPHISYQSVFIAVMGNMWEKDCWWHFQDMVKYTEAQGYEVSYQEIDDYSFMRPRDAIGTMRSMAAMMAVDSGFEWCFMVDTDALLEKDTLVRLLQSDCPIIYPYLIDLEQKWAPGGGAVTLMRPVREPNTGIHPVVWSAMSVMLFYTKVFNAIPAHAWYGHDIHFSQYLNHVGHRIFVDTNTFVKVVKGPSRHAGWTWDEIQEGMKKTYHKLRNEDRDRRPPEGYDPAFGEADVTPDGAYWATLSPVRRQAPAVANNDFGHPDVVKTEGGVG